jgi:pimeloyl-ACP methyl ester carboxylesterase
VFDELRAAVLSDRSQFWKDLSMPFYGYNRPGAKISEGVRNSFWLQGMMAGFPAAYFCIKAFSEMDTTEDLKKFDVPTLILHGDDDQSIADRRIGHAFIQDRRLRFTRTHRTACARSTRTKSTPICWHSYNIGNSPREGTGGPQYRPIRVTIPCDAA